MIIYKEWFVILSLVERVIGSATLNTQFSYQLNPSIIQPGEHTVLELRVPLEPQEDENSVQIFDELLMQNKSITLIQKSVEMSKSTLKIKYELTGYKDSETTIPPISIKKIDNTYSSEGQKLKIKALRAEDDTELRPGFKEVTPPLPLWKWTKTILFFFALALIGYLVYRKLKTLRPKHFKLRIPMPKARVTPFDYNAWLKAQLQELKSKIERDGAQIHFVDHWTDLVRKYYSHTSPLPTRSFTTRELKSYSQSIPAINELIPYFENCDSLKFNGQGNNQSNANATLRDFLLSCITATERGILKCA